MGSIAGVTRVLIDRYQMGKGALLTTISSRTLGLNVFGGVGGMKVLQIDR